MAIAQARGNLVDGAWSAAADGRSFTDSVPATGDELAMIPRSGAADVERAVAAAAAAFPAWSRLPAPERGAILFRFADRLRDAKLDHRPLRSAHPTLYRINFSSERKRMTSVARVGDRLVALVKGAPEMLLERSTHYLATDGSAREWTPMNWPHVCR